MSSGQITELLARWGEGDEHALDELIPLVYDQLRTMARLQLLRERPGHTLQPTALVNEAYIKMANQPNPKWNNRAHFLAVAALAMRQVLVDYARKRNREKGPGKKAILPLDDALVFGEEKCASLLALDDALVALSRQDARGARVVELRIFGGLTNQEITEVLGISENTVTRNWNTALAELGGLMRNGEADDRGTKKED